ncbi:Uncharacterized protein Rs2_47227 [Raphanus sativus]|nr:Uncharacterized protein Rs2_47227 [Raphanus sativus]
MMKMKMQIGVLALLVALSVVESCFPLVSSSPVNTSGLSIGLAEMTGPVDFETNVDSWQHDKWTGSFLSSSILWTGSFPNSLLAETYLALRTSLSLTLETPKRY